MKTQFTIADVPDCWGRWQVRVIVRSGNWYMGSWAYKPTIEEVHEEWKNNRRSFVRI